MKRYAEVDNNQDIIDSRDVIRRIEELESEVEDTANCNACGGTGEIETVSNDPEVEPESVECSTCSGTGCNGIDTDSVEYAELKVLKDLAEQCEGYGDWHHGEALIRDSHFEDYARELADDLGMLKDDSTWPYTCIDWEKAAGELQQDYTSVEFDGVTYWMRS